MKHIIRLAQMLVLTLVVAGASRAQAQDDTAPASHGGPYSLSLSLPAGGNPYLPAAFAPAAGIWYLLKPNINIGFNAALMLDPQTGGTNWAFGLAPSLRYYLAHIGSVSPYAAGQVNLLFKKGVDPELDLLAGFGVEYFVTGPLSVTAQTGLLLGLVRPAPSNPILIQTFTSNIAANVYF
jgi:hypothetical protein